MQRRADALVRPEACLNNGFYALRAPEAATTFAIRADALVRPETCLNNGFYALRAPEAATTFAIRAIALLAHVV